MSQLKLVALIVHDSDAAPRFFVDVLQCEYSKGRHLDGEHVEPTEQVLSEASIPGGATTVTVAGGGVTGLRRPMQ